MGLGKLMPVQGWIFLGILVAGAYFVPGAVSSFQSINDVSVVLDAAPGSAPLPSVQSDDLSRARILLTGRPDIAAVDDLTLQIAAAQAHELPGLHERARLLRISAETRCLLVVGKTAEGGFEVLSRSDEWVRPSVRCIILADDGEIRTVQGLAPSPPWMKLSDIQSLEPLPGRSLVQVGEKPEKSLSPTWAVTTRR